MAPSLLMVISVRYKRENKSMNTGKFGLSYSCNGNTNPIIKGPDNPTCQLLPTSSKRKAKTAWGKQEREKRW